MELHFKVNAGSESAQSSYSRPFDDAIELSLARDDQELSLNRTGKIPIAIGDHELDVSRGPVLAQLKPNRSEPR